MMSTITRTVCDICGTLLVPSGKEIPWSMETHFESVRVTYVRDGKNAGWDLCPNCVKRMKKYLKKHGAKMDGEADE